MTMMMMMMMMMKSFVVAIAFTLLLNSPLRVVAQDGALVCRSFAYL
jgi:uncharacterized membrane protein YjjB (DUF3815 family)